LTVFFTRALSKEPKLRLVTSVWPSVWGWLSGLKLNSLLVFIDLLHDLRVHLLNPFPDLSMEILDLFSSLLGLPTILGRNGEWGEVQGSHKIASIDHLERGECCSIARCPMEGKLRMREELIPPLDSLLHKGSK